MAKNSATEGTGNDNVDPIVSSTVIDAPRKSKKNEERSSLQITTPTLPGFDSFIESMAQLYRHSQDGILIENEERKILFVNSAFCSIFNIDTPIADLLGTDSVTLLRKNISMLRDANSYVALTKRIIKEKEHSVANEIELESGRVFSFDYAPLTYNNIYTGNFWKYLDITEKATADRKLKHQKDFYEKILNNIPGDIAVFDPAHRYLFLNPEAVRNPEMREWLIGKNDEDYCRYTNKPYNIAETRHVMFARAFSSRQPVEWEERLAKKDGSGEYHLRKMFPVLDTNGDVEMVVGYSTNVTRNKAIIDQAQKSQKRYKEIFNFSQAWICTHTLEGEILTINPAACKLLGYTESELLGKNVSQFLHPKMQKEFQEEYLQKIIDTGVTDGILTIFSRKGEKIHMLYQNYLLSEPDSEPYVIGFAQNITDRLYAEEALKRSEEKYRKIIENMNLGMLELDDEERIIFANQQFCTMSGYDTDELYGEKADEIFPETATDRIINEQSWKSRYGISNRYEFMVHTKSGEARWWLVSTAPLHNPDGSLKGSIGIHLDITRQKKMEKDLRDAMQAAERSSQAKEAFLANMSHEIRTPINAIMGMGKLLAKSNLNKQQLFYLSSIRTASENLLVVINDVLDISKIEAGKVNIENIPFDMDQLVRHAINMLAPKAEEKGLSVVCEVDENISHSLIGDPYRINQVMMNMLSNAIKFTEQGRIRVGAEMAKKADGMQQVVVTIEDTGIGISEDFLAVIFNKFTQEDDSFVRKFGGTGLGMSITKQLMDLMGGTIAIESEKNLGTTVTLTFNLKVGTAKIFEKKRAVKTDTSNIGNKKVLLVEDNELNRLLAYTILTQYGAIVTSADNGLTAIEMIQRDEFDIVLMDVQMPVMDGVRATQIIREKHNKSIPIIALTANALKGKREEYISAGMNDYIAKPYNEEKMIAVIANWLHRIEKDTPPPAAFKEEKEEVIVNDDDAPLYDVKKLMVKCGNNAEFVTQMLSLFVTDVPQTMAKIRDAYEISDLKNVKYLAHRIRPALMNMSINSIREESFALETLAANEQRNSEMERIIDKMTRVINAVTSKLKAEYNI